MKANITKRDLTPSSGISGFETVTQNGEKQVAEKIDWHVSRFEWRAPTVCHKDIAN